MYVMRLQKFILMEYSHSLRIWLYKLTSVLSVMSLVCSGRDGDADDGDGRVEEIEL